MLVDEDSYSVHVTMISLVHDLHLWQQHGQVYDLFQLCPLCKDKYKVNINSSQFLEYTI